MDGHDPLALDREAMREMGYRMVDMLVERVARVADEPVLRVGSRELLDARIGGPAPEDPVPFPDLLRRLDEDVLPFAAHWDHPRFFGYIPGSGTWPAALGDLVAAAANIDAGAWREASGPSQLELTVLDWFRTWVGYPDEAGGILVSGGSAANLAAIACAREILAGAMSPRLMLYVGDQAHSSIARAARHLGFRPDQLRVIPTDAGLRMRLDDLAAAIDADAAAGRTPFLVAAAAGATNTGAVDDLVALSALCRERGVWLHVDAAYGGFAVLTDRGRERLAGLDLADSVTLDPHKWLLMPFEVGCLMVRAADQLERAFSIHPEYLAERAAGRGEVDFADRGLQLTRATRAIKVWLGLSTFGVGAYRTAIDTALDLAALAEETVRADTRLQLVTPASLGIVTLRCAAAVDEREAAMDRRNAAVVAAIAASGQALVTGTQLRGRYVIRLCVMNHLTAADDVTSTLELIAATGVALAAAPSGSGAPERDAVEAELRTALLEGELPQVPGVAVDLSTFGPLADATADQAARFLATGTEEHYPAGAVITEMWEFSRTLYLVLEGSLSVLVHGREVDVREPGSYVGEIAAIEWGRDFGYARTATIVAREPARLLAVPGSALRDLMAESPAVDRGIRVEAQRRLLNR